HAQLPNSATLVFEHRKIYDDTKKDGSFIEPDANSTPLLQYFNLAHCNCAKTTIGTTGEGTFQYVVRETVQSGLHVPVAFWAGTGCDTQANRTGTTATCTMLDQTSDIDVSFFPGGVTKSFNLFQVVTANTPNNPPMGCPPFDNVPNSIFALVDTNGGTNYN